MALLVGTPAKARRRRRRWWWRRWWWRRRERRIRSRKRRRRGRTTRRAESSEAWSKPGAMALVVSTPATKPSSLTRNPKP